jgi:hypothetical protein
MKTFARIVLIAVAASLWTFSPSAKASEVIFSQYSDNQSTFGPSQFWPAADINTEIADDFNVVANIDRISASGFVWGPVDFQGVYIRFYEVGLDNKPGALQREYFFAAGHPDLSFNSVSGGIDVYLSPTFAATGWHFLSVQPVINYWYWWSANVNAPRGQAFYFRNKGAGELWHHGDNLNSNVNADVSFYLYGAVSGPGVIEKLSAATLPRSGFLEIFGANLGGGGTVLIDGISAPVADWTSTRIVAYVPEAAGLTTVSVQVVNSAGASNASPLSVTPRPAATARVNWRFRMNGPYSEVRPAIGPDKTVYAIDAFQHLYALSPDGGLKWLVRGAGDKGLAVGLDGTIYVASESFISAYNPDGSAKWRFVLNPRAMITLGVSVGPDGNIYSVGTEGPGVFSLSPAGNLRWQQPESYDRPIVDYGEIVFGLDGGTPQLYFSANNHTRALRLDGTPAFTLTTKGQPAVAPDGSVHFALGAYSPTGSLLWTFQTPYPYNVFTPPDIGTDGVHYFVQNLSQLFALNPNGSQRWHATLNAYVGGPMVDPSNTQLIMGSADTLDHAGFIMAASAQDGHELWRVTLPPEDPTVFNPALGIYGWNQFVSTRARFALDGTAAYLMTATATGDNETSRSFVYSLNTSSNVQPTPSPTPVAPSLRSTSITLSATPIKRTSNFAVAGTVVVKDEKGAAISGATVAVTWQLPTGAIQTQSRSNERGVANFSVTTGRGTCTLTVTNISKTGCTFDSVDSVLSKSIAIKTVVESLLPADEAPPIGSEVVR